MAVKTAEPRVKEEKGDPEDLPSTVEELRELLLAERAGRKAEAEARAEGKPAPRKGWRILTPIANYSGTMHSRGRDGAWVEVEFRMGEAFVTDRHVARALASDFGYFTDPAFDDVQVLPQRWISESADGTKGQWAPFLVPAGMDDEGRPLWLHPVTRQPHRGSGMPEGYERRVMVRA